MRGHTVFQDDFGLFALTPAARDLSANGLALLRQAHVDIFPRYSNQRLLDDLDEIA